MNDLRFALRLIRQNWAFSLTVIAILALCIGANTAVLSMVNAAMVAPLPYPAPDRLYRIVSYIGSEYNGDNLDGWMWELVSARVPSLDAAVFRGSRGVNLGFNGAGVFIREQRISTGYFHVFGIAPELGREFTSEEDRAGGANAVVLSHALWRTFFNADPAVIGRAILLRGEPYTVVGVMPAKFRSDSDADVWTPLRPSHTGEGSGLNYGIVARLKPGATVAQASAELQALVPDLHKLGRFGRNAFDARLDIESMQMALTRELRRPLMILWAAVAAVFVLGCVNIGGMMLARASGRMEEIATRLALGAPPGRIIRQLLIESVTLGSIGGLVGIGVGIFALDGMKSLGASTFDFLTGVEMDWHVTAAAIALTFIAAIGFGIAPAWQAAHLDLRAAQTGSRNVAGRKRFVPLGGLVGGRVAITIPLLIGAGLLLRTFLYLWTLSPGFDPNHVLTARFSMADARYNTPKTMHYYDAVIARLHEIPGVEQAAVALSLPYERGLNVGLRRAGDTRWRITDFAYVTPEYFAALRISLLQGRLFSAADGANTAKVAIANQAFVDLYFQKAPALGEMITVDGELRQIIGVTQSVQQAQAGWGDFGPNARVPTVYVPAAQIDDVRGIHGWVSPNWIVRSSLPTEQVRAAVEQTAHSADPLVPIAAFRSINNIKSESLSFQKFLAMLTNAIALLAILLTALGIYGLIANMVNERTRELGVRLALGSSRGEAVWTALRPALVWVGGGLVMGTGAAVGLERFVRSFLWGVQLTDAITLLAVAAGFIVATALASFAPAAAIVRLNPADTLKSQ